MKIKDLPKIFRSTARDMQKTIMTEERYSNQLLVFSKGDTEENSELSIMDKVEYEVWKNHSTVSVVETRYQKRKFKDIYKKKYGGKNEIW